MLTDVAIAAAARHHPTSGRSARGSDSALWSSEGRRRSGRGDEAMPFKSQQRRRKFAQFLVERKISNKTYET